jgi:hypothetical protein
MLRDSIKADLLELLDERFKDFDQRLTSKATLTQHAAAAK